MPSPIKTSNAANSLFAKASPVKASPVKASPIKASSEKIVPHEKIVAKKLNLDNSTSSNIYGDHEKIDMIDNYVKTHAEIPVQTKPIPKKYCSQRVIDIRLIRSTGAKISNAWSLTDEELKARVSEINFNSKTMQDKIRARISARNVAVFKAKMEFKKISENEAVFKNNRSNTKNAIDIKKAAAQKAIQANNSGTIRKLVQKTLDSGSRVRDAVGKKGAGCLIVGALCVIGGMMLRRG